MPRSAVPRDTIREERRWTPTPWEASGSGMVWTVQREVVADCSSPLVTAPRERKMYNAARICECVNAMEGKDPASYVERVGVLIRAAAQLAEKYEAAATDPNEGMSDEDYALIQVREALLPFTDTE